MNQKQKTWEINGISLPLDLDDADVVERYENAFERMEKEEKEITQKKKQSDKIRAYCIMYRHLYNWIFGDGTAEKIFQGMPMNSAVYDDVYCKFLEFVQEQAAFSARQRAERLNRYKPDRKA